MGKENSYKVCELKGKTFASRKLRQHSQLTTHSLTTASAASYNPLIQKYRIKIYSAETIKVLIVKSMPMTVNCLKVMR